MLKEGPKDLDIRCSICFQFVVVCLWAFKYQERKLIWYGFYTQSISLANENAMIRGCGQSICLFQGSNVRLASGDCPSVLALRLEVFHVFK